MKRSIYVFAVLAICTAPTLAAAQSAVIEGGGARNEVRRDGEMRGQVRDGDWHEQMGARAELNGNPYARRVRHSHAEHVIVVKHRRHHHHEM
jgi:hypothetical protein